MKFTRRQFGASLGVTPLALAAQGASARPINLSFPKGFVWGSATASYQIEGATTADGRGASIWDMFCREPGRILDGSSGENACDSYHRYADDTRLLRDLGAKAYRFSIAWPRIFPEGRGQPNLRGLDHYKRVCDNLLENGIVPYVTLFHWDLPAALPGGWQSRDTAQAFADYAATVAAALGDRVQDWMTMNECKSFVDLGYGTGIHAPGLKLPPRELAQVRHHALLAHGLGVRAIRAHATRPVRVGFAENSVVPVPVIETAEHITAARKAMRLINMGYITPMMEGEYPAEYLAGLGADAPAIHAGDMATIGSPVDFVGLNLYSPRYVKADPASAQGYAIVTPPTSFPRMVLPWLMPGPEGTYWGSRFISELWHPKAIYFTENGCASDDRLVDGRVDDTDRLMFLRNYISHLHRATAEGYPVKGYFLWSLLDNFEWAEGYTKRFGIHYTDYTTQRRIPKLSAHWFRELIRRNALV